ncbi:hypothetical protein BJX65DRAFT_175698 [Aspergillus insuetus]
MPRYLMPSTSRPMYAECRPACISRRILNLTEDTPHSTRASQGNRYHLFQVEHRYVQGQADKYLAYLLLCITYLTLASMRYLHMHITPRIIDGACPKCMAIASFVRHRYEDEMRDRTCTTTGRLSVVIGWLVDLEFLR